MKAATILTICVDDRVICDATATVTASTTSSCENFVVYVAGRLFINVIIGTCSVADFRSLDATFSTSGGAVEVNMAGGQTSWSFTEVR